MIRIVTGGARSGKSSFAESAYEGRQDVVYIATSIVTDGEMQERVDRHRESRPKGWRTFEGYSGLTEALGSEKNYLLDCITIMTSNILFEESQGLDRISRELKDQVEDRVVGEVRALIEAIRRIDANLILVTNELGSSIVPDNHLSRVFRDIQGRVNQRLAELCDEAYLVVLGCAVKLK